MATMATATGEDKWPAAAEKDLERVRELGRGNFGAVWLCKSKKAAQTKKTGDDKDLTAGYVAVKVRRLCVGTFEPCVRSLNHSLARSLVTLVLKWGLIAWSLVPGTWQLHPIGNPPCQGPSEVWGSLAPSMTKIVQAN